ncbi:G2/mitotic-specific cyclin-B [Cordyceps fumosorosea ARSEF 2679]|uniref:G2/mitotic-specific cyclin-B n=1 Tax=Cordyceps fumosorosea (strain ARSEF 2679) TaxID=1081104 RepID=A0A162MM13_CORFA|nr:G2/mitotic-specific cyclin-B [Cordyceps fumosorosea ARSEF 2679]OAA63970.1 G2/mitotic-specific cyclin-B [Cordyceps fumosorosea ARSEF 2679]
MPVAARTTRRAAATNENDENSTTRMTTRAAKSVLGDQGRVTKGAPQSKKSTTVSASTRSALNDLSNRARTETAVGKKPVAGKTMLASKAQAPTQKAPARAATKVPPKESKRVEKRPSATSGTAQKRKLSAQEKENLLEIAKEPVDEVKVEKKPMVVDKATTEVPNFNDIDDEDRDDPLMVAEYATEIFEYLRELEGKSIPNSRYMQHQDELEWSTRGILVDWLIEVHTRFHLLPETLFLAVNIVDRFLSKKVIQLDNFQLVGITAMFIASKYEEVLSPYIGNFKKITNDGFTEEEILSAERFVLSTLDYDLSYPNPMNFLRRVSKADNYDIQSRTIGKYLTEISLLDHRFMSFPPSQVAAAAMYMSRLMLDRGEWDEMLAHYAGYTEEELEPVVQLMVDYLARPVVHEAFFKKYANKKFLKASIISRQWAKKNAPIFGITDTDLSLYHLDE